MLITAGVMLAAAVAVLGGAGRQSSAAPAASSSDIDARRAAADPAPAFPEGLEATYPGITPLRTPNADFYRVDTALTFPGIDPDTWTLHHRRRWSSSEIESRFDELLAMPLIERDITLTCVSNEVGGPLRRRRPVARGPARGRAQAGRLAAPAPTDRRPPTSTA